MEVVCEGCRVLVLGGDLCARLQGVPWWNGIGRFCAEGGRLGEGPRGQQRTVLTNSRLVGKREGDWAAGDWTGALERTGADGDGERAKAWDRGRQRPREGARRRQDRVSGRQGAARDAVAVVWPWPWPSSWSAAGVLCDAGPDQRIGGNPLQGPRPKAQQVSGGLAVGIPPSTRPLRLRRV